MMKNKKLAICLIIFACLATIVVLSRAIFALNSASVNFLETPQIMQGKEQQIIESANFAYGSNVLFLGKKGYTQAIEKANPYIKVVNIETVFPNKFVIHCVERQEVFAFQQKNGTYAIIDEEFKVLKTQNEFLNTTTNAILLTNLDEVDNYEEGDFISLNDRQKSLVIATFYSLREWKTSYSELKNKVENVEIDYKRDNQVLIQIRNNVKIIVKDAHICNSDKLNLAFSAYESDTKFQSDIVMEVRQNEDNIIKIFYTKQGQ